MIATAYAYRCGHEAAEAPRVGTRWLYDCDACRARREAEAKQRVGWTAGPVYTVIGEMGNSSGPYTRELPSLAAAMEAIRADDLPFAPVSRDGGLRQVGNIVTFTVTRSHCYEILEHEPATKPDPVTRWCFGGIYSGSSRVFRLADGTVRLNGEHPADGPNDQIPPAWLEYRRALAGVTPRNNYETAYRDVLGI